LLAIFSTQFIIAQTFTDGLNSIYKEGYPSIMEFGKASILNVKLSPDNEIWATISFADGTQRACKIKNDKSEFSISRVKGEDNTLIAGFNAKGKTLLSVGFPDGRKIYEGDRSLIRSTYTQRDIVEIEPEDYLVTIQKYNKYQIYRYKKGITKYPELVFEGFENSDLINLSYYNNVLLFDSYSDGVYTPYYTGFYNGIWRDPKILDIQFLDSCRSISFSDSIIVAIKGNQLMIWEIIPDSYWEWEELTEPEQVTVSHGDTATTQIKFFYWHPDDVKGNFIKKSIFDSLGLSMDEEFVLYQSEDVVLDRMGDVFDDAINPSGYIFSSSDFDVTNLDANPDTNTNLADNTTNDVVDVNVDVDAVAVTNSSGDVDLINLIEGINVSVSLAEFILLIDNAESITLQVGAYGETAYQKHQKHGGFVKIIGGNRLIRTIHKDGLYKYQIDLTTLKYSKVMEVLQKYEELLSLKKEEFYLNDTPFLIISEKNGVSYEYKNQNNK